MNQKIFFLLYLSTLALSTQAIAASPSFEYQWAICDSLPSTVKKIESPFPERAIISKMKSGILAFFDTDTFSFHKNEIQLRLRAKPDPKFTVKVAYPGPGLEDKDFFQGENTKCEWDIKPNKSKYSCSHTSPGTQPSKEQFIFLNKLSVAPIHEILKQPRLGEWKYSEITFILPNSNFEFTLDSAAVDNKDLIEISFRSSNPEPLLAQRFEKLILAKGIMLCQPQKGRIERAIELRNSTAPTAKIDF